MVATTHAWIIGASSGIGRALVEAGHKKGWKMLISARNATALMELSQSFNASPFALDATQHDQVGKVARKVFKDRHIDYVLFNVGNYQPMGLNNFSHDNVESMLRSNFLSATYLIEAITPLLKAQGGGHVLFNISASAYRGLPNAAGYGASKAALLHMIESLTPEAKQQNIRFRVINSGFVKTRLTDRNSFKMPFLMTPSQAAERIMKGLDSGAYEIAFPKRLTWPLKLMRVLPYSWYFALTERVIR